jgi:hypothetical protein
MARQQNVRQVKRDFERGRIAGEAAASAYEVLLPVARQQARKCCKNSVAHLKNEVIETTAGVC